MDIYWERQSGGLCRKHALNAYFGEPKITTEQFLKHCDEFNKYILQKGYKYVDVHKFDSIMSSRETIISYIIGLYEKKFCLHIPISERADINSIVLDDNFVFVYNPNHIYGYRKISGEWYKIDSLSGVHKSPLPTDPNLGFIIPRNSPEADFMRFQKVLNGIDESYISRGIGDLEVIFAICADIIGLHGGFKDLGEYFDFLRKYEDRPDIYEVAEVMSLVEFFRNYTI